MRKNAKTKRLERNIKRSLRASIKKERSKVIASSANETVITYIPDEPKQGPGYRARTDKEIVQATIDRFTAITMDAKASEHSKYTQYSDRKGKITTIVVVDSGVHNNYCHKNLAAALPFMKSFPSSRPLFSTHLRNSPINRRGKLIRPKLIFIEKGKGKVPQNKSTLQSKKHLVYPI